MIHNGATPKIEIDPETYDVRADGELLVCEPADKLPMAQRYFLLDDHSIIYDRKTLNTAIDPKISNVPGDKSKDNIKGARIRSRRLG